MKGKKRKCLSFLLCVSLILGMIPMTEKTVKAATELITSVEVMLARPFNTAKPCSKEDVLIFGANDRYVVGSLTWYEGTYNSYQQTRDLSVFNGSFMSGMAYTAVLNLHSKSGYEFSCDDSGIPDISEDNIAVNCNNVTLDKASSGSQNLRLYLNYGSKANILDDTKGNCFQFTWEEATGTLTLLPWNDSGIIVDYEDIFAGNSKIKKVVMEEGVTSIGDDAFAYCNNINTVSIPSTLEKWGRMSEATIQKYSVADDNRLYQVREDNSLYSKDGKVLIDCASNDDATSYEVPEGVEKIGGFAFDGGNSLVKLTLQGENLVLEDYALFHPYIEFIEIKEGVKSLGKNSSVGGVIINEIDLPSTVIDIGNFFKGLPTIQKINVAEENSIYKDVDGVVIRKQDGALVC
ncbi:MAG: leucine-rich repeat domain-containing protein, partial [Clostridiales bacterium]|nr:leucine-rich repeat domain-containing protein [Clostridiales bacterium]